MGNAAEIYLLAAIEAFDLGSVAINSHRFGKGHINDTFCVTAESGRRFILQRISSAAFPHPDELMRNMVGVTSYVRNIIAAQGGDSARETLTVIPTRKNENFYTDPDGRAWRLFHFIENTVCLQSAETPALFYASAVAFGRFQYQLRDYPANTLFETIERFHDTENRLSNFKKALAADPVGRAKDVQREAAFVLAHEADCSVAMSALRQGALPLRVTHNDTKLNNVLIDEKTGKGLCIIDLDTVMPGLSINDFGDSIRFGANHSAEDERDLSKVSFDLALFDVYTKGFLEGAQGALTAQELAYLPWGAKLMTLECGMRFLTDYLEGDHYFATHREGQNLDRCRTQFKLVADMEKNWDAMNATVQKYT